MSLLTSDVNARIRNNSTRSHRPKEIVAPKFTAGKHESPVKRSYLQVIWVHLNNYTDGCFEKLNYREVKT